MISNLSTVVSRMGKLGHAVFRNASKPYNLNIVGIRAKERTAGRFDDRLVVFWPKPDGGFNEVWFSRVTTDPGQPWLANPATPRGAAILKAGQYRGAYAIDYHAGKYKALCQRLGKVTVWRDNNKDEELDISPVQAEEAGYFGINIHRATSSGTSLHVGRWSAGCQVFANSDDFDLFMQLCENAAKIWGNKFTYTLLEE